MIVYQKNKQRFFQDVREDSIAYQVEQCVLEKLGRKTSKSEFDSWRHSLVFMRNAIDDPDIPGNCGVSIEFQIPSTSKRIDFILSGHNDSGQPQVIIVELKQWSSSEVTQMDGMVLTYVGGRERAVQHPSYQAWSYAAYLEDFNEHVYTQQVSIQPCAFLHNYPRADNAIINSVYQSHINKAPVFREQEGLKLAEFIKRFVKTGDNGETLYDIENGRIRPSKGLADSLVGLIKGKAEFTLLDEQKEVFELVKAKAIDPDRKTVFIVDGGPGTGKSVVAINLLVDVSGQRLNCHYVTKNSAPREVFQAKLTGTLTKTQYANLFKSSGSYIGCQENDFDLLVVDEAHRLNEKTGMFRKGENQIKELIHATKVSVFFVDPHQRVAFSDIGSPEAIEQHAKDAGANVVHLSLPSQFRCAGSDGYLAWVDHTLGIRDTANTVLDEEHYDFRVFDDPKVMYDTLLEYDRNGESSRLLAGYCWPWVSKKNPLQYDIEFEQYNFRMRWNDFNLGQGWIMHPQSVEQVGCIHTSQGLEVAYAGVIIGRDLKLINGELVTDPLVHPGQDKNFSGLRSQIKKGSASKKAVLREADTLIRNTYRTLMTRGMKGTFVYCEDPELREHVRKRCIR